MARHALRTGPAERARVARSGDLRPPRLVLLQGQEAGQGANEGGWHEHAPQSAPRVLSADEARTLLDRLRGAGVVNRLQKEALRAGGRSRDLAGAIFSAAKQVGYRIERAYDGGAERAELLGYRLATSSRDVSHARRAESAKQVPADRCLELDELAHASGEVAAAAATGRCISR